MRFGLLAAMAALGGCVPTSFYTMACAARCRRRPVQHDGSADPSGLMIVRNGHARARPHVMV